MLIIQINGNPYSDLGEEEMDDLKKLIKEHVQSIDFFLEFSSFSEKNLVDWMQPMIDSMTDGGAIPYLLEEKKGERYRASPLASSLVWMNAVGILPEYAIDTMQEKLLYLRDNCEPSDKYEGNPRKENEDKAGWSLAEGASVWSTSFAIIAMLDNKGIGVKKAERYKESVLWLVKQQKTDKNGWGYQLSANCTENTIMTALATWAIALALKNKSYFMFDENEERLIRAGLKNGFCYLKENIRYKKRNGTAYWCFDDKESCTATVWSLTALKHIVDLDISQEISSFFKENLRKALNFILYCIFHSRMCATCDERYECFEKVS